MHTYFRVIFDRRADTPDAAARTCGPHFKIRVCAWNAANMGWALGAQLGRRIKKKGAQQAALPRRIARPAGCF